MNSDESHLLQTYQKLCEADQKTLTKFAQFLLENNPKELKKLNPKPIERPKSESVIKAIKRLKQTYYMLPADDLMNETSKQMSAHLIKGKSKSDTINDLEFIFKQKYQQYLNND